MLLRLRHRNSVPTSASPVALRAIASSGYLYQPLIFTYLFSPRNRFSRGLPPSSRASSSRFSVAYNSYIACRALQRDGPGLLAPALGLLLGLLLLTSRLYCEVRGTLVLLPEARRGEARFPSLTGECRPDSSSN